MSPVDRRLDDLGPVDRRLDDLRPVDQRLDDLRPVSFAIAYRMLGSVAEAEDVVQEALLRVHGAWARGEVIESPPAFVSTVTTRLAIDELRSARKRRERYVGDWLPEPILTDGLEDPARHAELADSLSMAMLVLLESLSPEQRAVLVLRDVFDYGYGEIAEIIGKSEDNVRQLAVRARGHVERRRPRFDSSRERRDELGLRFLAAARDGDLEGLEALLAADVVLTGDGGGQVPALSRSVHGRSRVARTLRNWVKLGARIPGATMAPVQVNGAPGALLLDAEQRVISVWALEIAADQIQSVRSIINPQKLAHLGPVADLTAIVASTANAPVNRPLQTSGTCTCGGRRSSQAPGSAVAWAFAPWEANVPPAFAAASDEHLPARHAGRRRIGVAGEIGAGGAGWASRARSEQAGRIGPSPNPSGCGQTSRLSARRARPGRSPCPTAQTSR